MSAGHAEQLRLAILEQFDAPTNEYNPLAHVEQLPTLTAPTALDDVPAGHLLHTLAPDTLEYVPALQFVHDVADVLAAN